VKLDKTKPVFVAVLRGESVAYTLSDGQRLSEA
jgi:hypothetical protein